MPTSKKKTTPVRRTTNGAPKALLDDMARGTRDGRIRQAKRHQADEAVPDSRDVAHSTPPATTANLDISRAPERGQALELANQLRAIVVTDKASHARALEMIRAGKEIKRKMTSHWQRITRSIDDLKRTMFGFRDDDIGPLDLGLVAAEGVVLRYENAEKERVRRREEEDRLARERKALEDRNRELEAAEDRALELEQQSEGLSARELWFVEKVYSNGLELANPTATDLRAMIRIATDAGYKKNVDVEVARLLRSKKILVAIEAKKDAAAIREQAEAKRQQPIHVVDTPPVEAQVAQGRGLPTTRTYYSAEVFDANQLREAFLNGKVDPQALIPNEVYLNAQARAAKSAEIFERAFPGVRLKSRQGLAG
jgi:hypothetical protein